MAAIFGDITKPRYRKLSRVTSCNYNSGFSLIVVRVSVQEHAAERIPRLALTRALLFARELGRFISSQSSWNPLARSVFPGTKGKICLLEWATLVS